MRLLYPLALLALGIQSALLFGLLTVSGGAFPHPNALAWGLAAILLAVPPAILLAIDRQARLRLETAEKRLGWAARSGKVVLRIALTQLARHYKGETRQTNPPTRA